MWLLQGSRVHLGKAGPVVKHQKRLRTLALRSMRQRSRLTVCWALWKSSQGLDTGQIFKALGTEAGPALLPVIQNLERYEELIKNQEEAQGTAAAAAATAAGTIEGAWKRVTNAFQNLFSDQTELGQVIRGTLLAAARGNGRSFGCGVLSWY